MGIRRCWSAAAAQEGDRNCRTGGSPVDRFEIKSILGFTAAAKLLNVGQPTVSTHVRALEDHFKVELFHRRGRTVELTEIGRMLMTITRGMFGHQEEAISLLRAAQALEIGSLKIGAIRPSDVMEIAAELRTRSPDLKLTVTLGSGAEILEGLLKFDFDVGVVGRQPQDPRFFSRFYNRHRILVLANASHPLARRRSIRIEDLEGQDFIVRAAGSTTRAIFDQALQKAVGAVTQVRDFQPVRQDVVAIVTHERIGVENDRAHAANNHQAQAEVVDKWVARSVPP